MNVRRVKFYKVVWCWLRSWWAFALAMLLLVSFWAACAWVVDTYAGKYLVYFQWGAWIAVAIGFIMLIFNEPLVVLSTGAKRVRCRAQSPKLWDAVHNLPIPLHARPVPRVYILPDWGMNAISFGWGIPFFSAIGATEGAVRNLTDEELAAVMAHEVGHVINKDILVSITMAISVMILATTGYILFRIAPYGGGSSRKSSNGGGGAVLLVAVLVGGVMYFVGRLLGVILQAFVSRQREYAADASSARLMGSSQPLASALEKIVNRPRIGSRTACAAIGFLCTADPEPSDVMATHPPIGRRLEALRRLEA